MKLAALNGRCDGVGAVQLRKPAEESRAAAGARLQLVVGQSAADSARGRVRALHRRRHHLGVLVAHVGGWSRAVGAQAAGRGSGDDEETADERGGAVGD